MPKLSAGRVQSVATRILVDRERERMAFRTADYWDIFGVFGLTGASADGDRALPLPATLVSLDARRVASGADFDAKGRLKADSSANVVQLDESTARGLADRLTDARFAVR